jgi:hypothetical protein
MKYICKKHPELGFYVDGELKKFSEGEYNTTDKKEMAVLDALVDVTKEEKAGDK